MQKQDSRMQAIQFWLKNELNMDIESLTPASSDASFRRYFRVIHQQQAYIVMDAPPEKEDIKPFIKVANLFAPSGINVPKIFHSNFEGGFLLLEDFGTQCYLDALNTDNADLFYQLALNSLFKLQTEINPAESNLPAYTHELLNKELDIFSDWFLTKKLSLTPSPKEKSLLDKTWTILTQSALEQPQACVHRDYHSRNLMATETNSPGIIDFQDAVVGPISYDLVSLLRDCYISWPEQQIEQWQKQYFQRLSSNGLVKCDNDTFQRWFDLMGMQRHLKAIGIFSRLQLRDNKPNYLQDIPRTMDYISLVSSRHPDLVEFNSFLQKTIIPAWNLTT